MSVRRLVSQNRDQRPVAAVKLEGFEQTHSTALVNDGFDGLNHVRRLNRILRECNPFRVLLAESV